MKLVVIDAQGGGIGKMLVEQLKAAYPGQTVLAVGTNAMATAAMMRGGADQGATGENAIRVTAEHADLILGPIGLILADAMLGEITPAMAQAIGASQAEKILIPVRRCAVTIAGFNPPPLAEAVRAAVQEVGVRLRGAQA